MRRNRALTTQPEDPWPVSHHCPEPRWFVRDPTSLAHDNISDLKRSELYCFMTTMLYECLWEGIKCQTTMNQLGLQALFPRNGSRSFIEFITLQYSSKSDIYIHVYLLKLLHVTVKDINFPLLVIIVTCSHQRMCYSVDSVTNQNSVHQRTTINDLGGARRKNRKWIYFFCGNAYYHFCYVPCHNCIK